MNVKAVNNKRSNFVNFLRVMEVINNNDVAINKTVPLGFFQKFLSVRVLSEKRGSGEEGVVGA